MWINSCNKFWKNSLLPEGIIVAMEKIKSSKALGLFDEDFRLDKLTKLGDPLVRLAAGIDFKGTSKNSIIRNLIFYNLLIFSISLPKKSFHK